VFWFFFSLFLKFIFIVVLVGGTLQHLKKFIQYSILEFTPFTILFYLSSPHSLNSFYWYYFPIYICVYSIYTIFMLPCPFLSSSSLPLVPTPQGRTCYAFQFSNFAKERKKRYLH
jgi:hypothetical protein